MHAAGPNVRSNCSEAFATKYLHQTIVMVNTNYSADD
jgi:hypothetical protein